MASPDWTPILVLLTTFVPLTFTGVILGSIAIVTYHRRTLFTSKAGAELAQEMLRRDMTAEEIERVLVAWSGDKSLARKLLISSDALPRKFVG